MDAIMEEGSKGVFGDQNPVNPHIINTSIFLYFQLYA